MEKSQIKEDEVKLDITLSLPKNLFEEAKVYGLLAPKSIEDLLDSELDRRRINKFFTSADKLAYSGLPQITDTEIDSEIKASRKERQMNANRR